MSSEVCDGLPLAIGGNRCEVAGDRALQGGQISAVGNHVSQMVDRGADSQHSGHGNITCPTLFTIL